MNKLKHIFSDSLFSFLASLLVCIGIAYRMILWWQNRGLFIDEANLARNIYERNFIELTQPLAHEQFAPPLFLWMSKLFTLLLGYDEKVFRFFPLFCGIATLLLFYNVARRLLSLKIIWYPMALLVTGAIYLRYSTEFKQYSSDAFIAILLVFLALKWDIQKTSLFRFLMSWIVVGSIAIWISMPAVFILASIGLYYFIECITHKNYKAIGILLVIATIWLAQFAYYYHTILQPQANSSYLQHFHQWYFLDAFPKSLDDFKNHNLLLLKGMTEAMGGKLTLSWVLNAILTFFGIYVGFKNRNTKLILFLFPLLLVFIASAMKSYSLMDRLMLFYFPLWFVLIGYGLEFLLMKLHKICWQIPVLLCCLITVFKFNKISYLTTKPLNLEAVNDCLDFLVQEHITSQNLYVQNLASGGYVYYTEIHPDKAKWKTLRNAHQLTWDADYGQLKTDSLQQAAFLSSSMGDDIKSIWEKVEKQNTIIATFDKTDAKVVVFKSK